LLGENVIDDFEPKLLVYLDLFAGNLIGEVAAFFGDCFKSWI